jgi:hypothetical protein
MILNSPQLLSKKYMSYRILRSPGVWAQAYIDRAKHLRPYKSALLFPEQLLPIAGANIYHVYYQNTHSNQTVEVSITKWTNPHIEIPGVKGMPTLEQLYDFEHENSQSASDLNLLKVIAGSWDKTFLSLYLFSGKRDALAFAQKNLKRICD